MNLKTTIYHENLPIIAMIFVSLYQYQGISQTSTAFAAGVLKEFNAPRVTLVSDHVSAVNTCQKITKKEEELLFYSNVDYERFEYADVDCLQALGTPMGVGVEKGHYFHCEHPICCTDVSLKACPARTTENSSINYTSFNVACSSAIQQIHQSSSRHLSYSIIGPSAVCKVETCRTKGRSCSF